MESSDEEGEIFPEHITEYHFVDDNENIVSFAILPVQWADGEIPLGPKTPEVFVSGNADSGLQKIYKSVIAWKLELSYATPMVLVLTKNRKWITLQKPRSSYRDQIRSIMITIYWLHFAKRCPEASRQPLWNHLKQAFSYYEIEPSENDLSDHLLLIDEMVKRDGDLAMSKCVLTFLEKPGTSEPSPQDLKKKMNSRFIVYEDEDDVSSDEETDLKSIFDTACSICDNGGTLLSCEGSCLRSFHPTEADGSDSACQSLGFLNDAQVAALPSFLCKNCLYKQHQCYACGEMGSSDTSSVQEVFSCSSATCGHFYHPECVARLLCADDENAVKLQETIVSVKSFICPLHKCYVCNQSEDSTVYELHLAICRRCPKAYHRKCLPKKITLEYTTENNFLQRSWDGLLPENRILIYCMDHMIIGALGTPSRDHLKYPHLEGKEKKGKLDMLSGKGKMVDSGQNISSDSFAANRLGTKKAKVLEKLDRGIEAYKENNAKKCSRQDFDILKKPNLGEFGKMPLEKNFGPDIDRRFKTKSKLYPAEGMLKPGQVSTSIKIKNSVQTMPIAKKVRIQEPLITSDIEKRILALMEDSTSSLTMEDVMKRRQIQSIYDSNTCNNMVDKTITLGRVEASVKAIRAALEKLEAGGSIDDAKTICGPEVVKQIFHWKGKLQVYLSPFLHGMRYTSFGRHFTKPGKLKEIVNRLCWYVQNGDTIVDFSCGSNDFSCLMNEKLETMGKLCSFKNYDLFRPKNDFNFEKRNWMSIKLNELPDGGQLIMGLNPPFGVKASLANMFIDQALKFRPKLIILIVPKETQRLNSKAPYDLVWEDDKILAGKSFYLPGSVDVDDKQLEGWNLISPPLYLWSRSDWTSRHKAIAQEHNHIYNAQQKNAKEAQEQNHIYNAHQKNAKEAQEQNHIYNAQLKNAKEDRFNYFMEETNNGYGDFFKDMQECLGLSGNDMNRGVGQVNDDHLLTGLAVPSEPQRFFPDLGSSSWKNQGMELETDMEIDP